MTPGPGRALGLDVGERRIGVAIADELGAIASPLTTVLRGSAGLGDLQRIMRERGVDRVVIGLPTGLSGREGPQAAEVRAFAEQMAERIDPAIDVTFWDERLTTVIAERSLRDGKKRRGRVKGEVDAVAAAVILQGYLDARRFRGSRAAGHGQPKPG